MRIQKFKFHKIIKTDELFYEVNNLIFNNLNFNIIYRVLIKELLISST